MSDVRIKICGLRTPADVRAVNAVLPDYAGFIFVPGRKRYITPETAEELRQQLDPRIRPVGVFVNAGTETILQVLQHCPIDMVQLHGEETEEEIRALRAAYRSFGRGELFIVQAFRVETEADIRRAEESGADEILLDHGAGGTGECFDWRILKDCRRRFFLAGGLTPENVADAIEAARPYGVDASSSLETDGHKDAGKIKKFTAAVRRERKTYD